MALGTITKTISAGESATVPLMADLLSFLGDSAYPTGGTTGFKALVQANTLDQRAPIAVIGQQCGGYTPYYDYANDKLLVYYGNFDASDGPLIQVPDTTDLSGVTFKVLVLSQ